MYSGTTEILEGDAEFVGPTRMTNRDDFVKGIVSSDADGSLVVEQSSDPLAADPRTAADAEWVSDTETTFAVTGGTPVLFSVPLYGPYWRLHFTNGETDQTEFRLDARTMSAGDS